MTRTFNSKKKKVGTSPGSVIFKGERKMDEVVITLMDYSTDHLETITLQNLDSLKEYLNNDSFTWINVDGIHDTQLITRLGELLNIHSLILEDIVNPNQRPRYDDLEDAIFITLRMLDLEEDNKTLYSEQVSLLLKHNFLVTFQEQSGDVFDPLRDRIKNKKGRIRSAGTDYLAFALLDSIVDHYVWMTDELGQQVDDIELELANEKHENPEEVVNTINQLKLKFNYLSKVIRPVRELVNNFLRTEDDFVTNSTRPYLKDLHDMSIYTVENIDTYREMLKDYLNVYQTQQMNRTNEVMQFLTIFASIFIPLTFIAGVYGTNFEYFPELGFKYSYPIFWSVCILVACIMLFYFKRKRWL